MDVPSELEADKRWRLAVWVLRIGYVALSIAAIGLVITLLGYTAWVLAIGVISWLVCVVIILPAFLLARHDLRDARPALWPNRMMLVYDSVHARRR